MIASERRVTVFSELFLPFLTIYICMYVCQCLSVYVCMLVCMYNVYMYSMYDKNQVRMVT